MPVGIKPQRVLVVEDDAELFASYRRFFEELHSDEFKATLVSDGEQALDVLHHDPVDLLVLDWGLPGISGASLARALRAHAKTRSLGILMVTGRATSAETISALESGADDHLAKPFDWNVLLARLRSLVRRRSLTFDRNKAKLFPGLEFDHDAGHLSVDGVPVRLTPKETDLFKVFLTRPGILHSQFYLWDAVWGYETDGWEHILTVTLSSLRRKLGSRYCVHLKTYAGRGYVFELG
jgi:two-component system phosphate regulon response regulator PhoB